MKDGLAGKRFEAVFTRAKELLEQRPRNVPLLSILGSAAYGLGRYREAEAAIRRALELKPDSQVLQDSLARIQKKTGG